MNVERWLEELQVPREAHRVVSLLPLVYVAWADGGIQGGERALILRIAGERGLLENGGAEALERWLTEPPAKERLRADMAVLNALARNDHALSMDLGADELQLLLAWCQDVADAAGGLLGLRSARKAAELDALKTIAAALDMGGARQWRSGLSPD